MDREDDRNLGGDRGQARHRLAQQRPVDEGGAVEGHQQVPAGLHSELGCSPRGADPVLERGQGVDHRVADEVHPVLGDPLGPQVLDRLIAVEEEMLGEDIGDDPVDLLGHRPIEAPQPRLYVGNGDQRLRRCQRRGERRVDVAGDEDQIGFLLGEYGLQPLHHQGGLLGVAAGADLEHVIWLGDAELLEEDLRHHPVVVLAGVDDRVAPVRVARPHRGDHRRGLDEVRTGTDHVDESQENASRFARCAINQTEVIWLAPRSCAPEYLRRPASGLLQYRSRCRR